MYVNSGGTPEYCKNFGLEINLNNIETKLIDVFTNYDLYQTNMKNYPFNSNKMCSDYEKLFQKMLQNKMKFFQKEYLK